VLFAGTVSDLVPHAVDDVLVYRVTDSKGKVTTETATTISSEPGGIFMIDDQVLDGEQVTHHEQQVYLDTGAEFSLSGSTDFGTEITVECDPALLHLAMPLIAGQALSTVSQCLGVAGPSIGLTYRRTDQFTPIELLDSLPVPAGTFAPVIHVRGSMIFLRLEEHDEVYLTPGVGVIFQTAMTSKGELLFMRELLHGTIGGQPIGPQ